MKVHLASAPRGRFCWRGRPAGDLLPKGLHLNRLGDRPERPWRPAVKGRHVIGCWLRVGGRYWSWVWPIRFEIDR